MVAEELARAACKPGHEVQVFAPGVPPERDWPFRVLEIPNRGTLGWGCRLKTLKLIRQRKDEFAGSILHLVEPGPILACMYGQLAGLTTDADKLILTLHGSEILRFSKTPHRRWLFKQFMKKVDWIHFLSNRCKQLFQEHFPTNKNCLVVIPGAARSFHGESTTGMVLPESTGKQICLTVARIHPRKGQHACLEAIQKLPENLRNKVEYWIAGSIVDKSYQQRLLDMANRATVTVRFLGEIADADLPCLYSQADLFVMTSVPHAQSIEGFGLVYLEAASYGIPAIGHRTGGVQESVKEGETGLLCDPNNRHDLVEAFRCLLQDEDQRRKMGASAIEFAKCFSWKAMACGLYD